MDKKAPFFVTEVPGPKAKEFLARDSKIVTPSLPRAYDLVINQAQGAVVEDVDGNTFLDFAAGIAVCSTRT